MELTIAQLERTLPSGVVYNIHYRFDLTDGDYSKGAYGTVSVTGDPNADGFIAFDDLTEDNSQGVRAGCERDGNRKH
jgi:hypothetical protein